MGLSDLSSREAVLKAIKEFKEMGKDAFLNKYGFKPSKKYYLFYDFDLYDSKPIVAAAYGFQYPDRGSLKSHEFSGGKATVQKRLESLGFFVHVTTDPIFPFEKISFLQGISNFEQELGVPEGFISKLIEEDDWSFIVKMHALIEAAITHLLVVKFDDPSLSDIFSRLELSNFRTGKIAFIASLGLLNTDVRRFIQKLSELRNAFIHDVTNVNLILSDYFSSLPNGKLRGYRKAFCWGFRDTSEISIQINEDLFDGVAMIKAFAVLLWEYVQKMSIWLGGILVIREIYSVSEARKFEAAINLMDQRIARLISQIFKQDEST